MIIRCHVAIVADDFCREAEAFEALTRRADACRKNERRSTPLHRRKLKTENLGGRDFASSKARVFSAYLNLNWISSPEVSNFSIFSLPI